MILLLFFCWVLFAHEELYPETQQRLHLLQNKPPTSSLLLWKKQYLKKLYKAISIFPSIFSITLRVTSNKILPLFQLLDECWRRCVLLAKHICTKDSPIQNPNKLRPATTLLQKKNTKYSALQRTMYVKQNRWVRCRPGTNTDKNIASRYLWDFSDHKLTRGHRAALRLHYLVAARRHSIGTDFLQRDWQSTWAINSPLSPFLLNRKASHF